MTIEEMINLPTIDSNNCKVGETYQLIGMLIKHQYEVAVNADLSQSMFFLAECGDEDPKSNNHLILTSHDVDIREERNRRKMIKLDKIERILNREK